MPIHITTTNSIENSTISRYFTPITANVVVGTNIFGDISASFTDLFGGRSESYEKRLKAIYQQALSNIEKQAIKLGANAIIGLKIDYNEISGKGMHMLMVSVTGTPVKAVFSNQEISRDNITSINGELVALKIQAKRLIIKITDTPLVKISTSDLEKIKSSSIPDFLILTPKWLDEAVFNSTLNDEREGADAVYKYLENLPIEDFKPFIYNYLFTTDANNIKTLCGLVGHREAIDLSMVINKLAEVGGKAAALHLLGAKKNFYDQDDLEILKSVIDKYDEFFPLKATEREEVSKGLFSKDIVKVWDCSCGKKVNGFRCGHCDKDAFGYTSNTPHPPVIKKYLIEKIEVLEELLKNPTK